MNKQHFLTGLSVICISLFSSQPVSAECGAGKTDITIINPAGKIIELCVPDAAVPAIEEGNPGTVIPATCPCFSQDEVDSANMVVNGGPLECTSHNGLTPTGLECSGAICNVDGGTFSTTHRAFSIPSPLPQDYDIDETCYVNSIPVSSFSIACKAPYQGGLSYGAGELTVQEADACLAILKAYLP